MTQVGTLPPDLHRRCHDLLAKLAVLSDAPTSPPGQDLAAPTELARARMEPGETWKDHSSARTPSFDSKPPPGVRERRGQILHPDFDNLFDWFVSKVTHARTETEIRMACKEAEVRLERTKGVADSVPVGVSSRELERERQLRIRARERRIAEDYPGLSALEVELVESEDELGYCPAGSVRRSRVLAGMDPETGFPLPAERKLRGNDRKRRARELLGEGLSARQIAGRFGVSHTTVLDWLGTRRREVA